MSNEIQPRQLTAAQQYGRLIEQVATRDISRMLGSEAGAMAASRVAMAFRQAAATAKDPSALYRCSGESIGACVAMSAGTGLMPGGAFAQVYLVPKGGTLGWWITHRGIIELARRAGYQIRATPVYHGEAFEFGEDEGGLRIAHTPDIDATHKPETLRGVLVRVYETATHRQIDALFVNRAEIEKRRMKSQMRDSGPWADWYVEMAIKTAVKYAAGRGVIAFDDSGLQALGHDSDVHIEAVQVQPTGGRAALGVAQPSAPAIAQDIEEYTAAEGERVDVAGSDPTSAK